MKTFSTICVVAITFACLASTCSAQGPLYHSSPYFAPPVPQYPVIVTQPQFNGYTPWGYNTYNEQIDNTYFMGNRGSSRYNGSLRNVTRPVYNPYGQVVGYETGQVWNNSITGQEHSRLDQFTDNGQGGTHHSRRRTSNRVQSPSK